MIHSKNRTRKKTQKDRGTERQRDRETDRQRDRETERQRDRETERHRDTETETDTKRDIYYIFTFKTQRKE